MLLPAPLRPMTPSACPVSTAKLDVAQRPDLVRRRALSKAAYGRGGCLADGPGGLVLAEAVALAQPLDLDGMVDAHMTSANRRSVCWKYASAAARRTTLTPADTNAHAPGGGPPIRHQRKPWMTALIGFSA